MNVRGINSVRFNHNNASFSCCTEAGVNIYRVDPLALRGRFELGGVLKCEVLNPSNLIAIIAGGNNARYCQNTVMIYDTVLEQFLMEIVCASGAKSVLMRRNKMIVVTLGQILVFTFPTDMRHIIDFETCTNPKGMCEITPSDTPKSIIAYPGNKIGTIHFMDISNVESEAASSPSILNAHQGEITCLAINRLGTLIASASSKETSMKIWNTNLKVEVAELKLGFDTAILYCINFSPNSELLCCSSNMGTINVFRVIETDVNGPSCSSSISLSTPYCGPQRALATFSVPSEVSCICTFLDIDSVAAICPDGNYHTFEFSIDGTSRHVSLQMYLFDILW